VSDRVAVAVVGASGYTGAELLRLCLGHPRVELTGVYARSKAGEPLARVFPQFAGRLPLTLEPFDPDGVAKRAEVAFLALPHGESAPAAAALVDRGMTVLDLSADFRLADQAEYAAWYGSAEHPRHPAPELLARAIYGLPELHREELRGARLVAVPGCYPTAAILAIEPLLAAGLVSPDGLVVDAKSGVSGAGRTPSLATHLPEAAEGIRPYKIAGSHRHTPEIEQELARVARRPVRLTFTPHLVPMSRGILACVYATPTSERPASAYQEAIEARWRGEPFVVALPAGQLPDTAFVRGSNRAHTAVAVDARAGRVVCLSAIDNLVKGAAGQALQAMNVALGLPETEGLEAVGLFP
jgi:N-acetyl-gamma-glutamyl-phosphate reductase